VILQNGRSRLELKRPTGWFAAGQEVKCALELLSDGSFKLFVWLCLHADRSRGTLSGSPAELARALGKEEGDIKRALEELERQEVCAFRSDGEIEIRDRFWPYQRRLRPGTSDDARRYVEEVKRVFLERRCVQSSFTIADEKMVLSLYNRRVSLNRCAARYSVRRSTQVRGYRAEWSRHTDQRFALLHQPFRRGSTGNIASILEICGPKGESF